VIEADAVLLSVHPMPGDFPPCQEASGHVCMSRQYMHVLRNFCSHGVLAQLVERTLSMCKVVSSILTDSTPFCRLRHSRA
jgi:hypothetical protein